MGNFFGGGGGSRLPALTDNGVSVTSTEPVFVPVTNSATIAGGIGGNANVGFNFDSSNRLQVILSSQRAVLWSNANFTMLSGMFLAWQASSSDAGAGAPDAGIRRRAAANIALGASVDVNGVPVAQTLSVQNAITGSNLAGSVFTIAAPLGTGTGAGAATKLQRALMQASGTTAQTSADAFAIGQSKTLSNTSATAQTVATITLGSNAGGGCAGTFTIVATDGTNFDAETQSFTVSYVNKATVVTVGTPAITTSTAANNSGSATLGITAVANGNNIDIKVTPVFTTIVPTTVTLFPTITHATGTVTFV